MGAKRQLDPRQYIFQLREDQIERLHWIRSTRQESQASFIRRAIDLLLAIEHVPPVVVEGEGENRKMSVAAHGDLFQVLEEMTKALDPTRRLQQRQQRTYRRALQTPSNSVTKPNHQDDGDPNEDEPTEANEVANAAAT
jgi:hypothetical protein